MKKTILAVFLLIFALTLISCGSVQYRDDVSVETLIGEIVKASDQTNKLALASDDYITEYMGIDISGCAEYAVMVPDSTTNMDEYAVFKAESLEKAAELQKEVDDYLKMRNDSWMPEYLPDQYPKIKNAESVKAGVYVMYTILDGEYRQDAADAVINALKSE